jgi:hypothetical protein
LNCFFHVSYLRRIRLVREVNGNGVYCEVFLGLKFGKVNKRGDGVGVRWRRV